MYENIRYGRLDATGIRPDAAYRDVESDLRDALTVGRPIAE